MSINTDTLQMILNKIDELTTRVNSIEQKVTGMMIDVQSYIPKRLEIEPGTGTKISYDKDGIVRGSLPLEATDIPALPMSKIEGLDELKSNTISITDLKKFEEEINKKVSPGEIKATGTKVNIDSNGNVVGIGTLTQEDIPQISIDHVTKLSDTLSDFNGRLSAISNSIKSLDDRIKSINSVSKNSDNSNDNSNYAQIVSEINELSQAIFLINQRLNRRDSYYSSPVRVPAGRYSAFTVDHNGTIVSADELTDVDVETIHAEINEMKGEISKILQSMKLKADSIEMTKLQNTLDRKISDIPNMRKAIDAVNQINDRDERLRKLDESVQSIDTQMRSVLQEKRGGGGAAFYTISAEIDSINRSIEYLMTTLGELIDHQESQ